MADDQWYLDKAAGRYWWDHRGNPMIPRIWGTSSGEFFISHPLNGRRLCFTTLADAKMCAEALDPLGGCIRWREPDHVEG